MAIKKFSTGDAVDEETDAEYECTFYDAARDAPQIESSAILTLVATLSDVDTGSIINNRDHQNVLGVNGGSFTADVFTLRFTGLTDMVIVAAEPPKIGAPERHRLQLDVTYDRGSGLTGYLHHEVWFDVINLKHGGD